MAEDNVNFNVIDLHTVITEEELKAQREAVERLSEEGEQVKGRIRELLENQALPESDIVSRVSEQGYDQEGVQVVLQELVGSSEVVISSGARTSWTTVSE